VIATYKALRDDIAAYGSRDSRNNTAVLLLLFTVVVVTHEWQAVAFTSLMLVQQGAIVLLEIKNGLLCKMQWLDPNTRNT
jgi:hypothetical protein